jgi:hypothetical protein
MSRAVLGRTEVAVIDLETTGIYPGGYGVRDLADRAFWPKLGVQVD